MTQKRKAKALELTLTEYTRFVASARTISPRLIRFRGERIRVYHISLMGVINHAGPKVIAWVRYENA